MNDNRALATLHSQAVSMSLPEMERLGQAMVGSGLFGIKTAEQALALMAICQADGIHPAKAAQMYHIIQGRAALKSDAMLARFQQAGGKVQWLKSTDQEVEAEFSHPQGGTMIVRWGMEDAKRAKLAGKENWQNYPRQMLRARVISEGVRATFPGVITGFYTPEEVADFTEAPASELKQAEATQIQPEAEVKKEKRATVTGEVKKAKPKWSDEQTSEAGEIRRELMEIGGDTADKELRKLYHDMAYDDPVDTLEALSALLAKWRGIKEDAEPVVVEGADR